MHTIAALISFTLPSPLAPTLWTHTGATSAHDGRAQWYLSAAPGATRPLWSADSDEIGVLEFLPHAGVAADQRRVYTIAFGVLAAFDLASGESAWSVEVPLPLLDSWSSPTLDPMNHSVIIASSFVVEAFDATSGAPLWSTDIGRPIVNASPCVTHDLHGANRVFITDHSFGAGATGTLVCINTSPYDPAHNPYHPGDIVWERTLPGNTSGCTPSYENGVVYVATSDDGAGGPGSLLAFDATSTSAPTPMWTCVNPQPLGFFSAVTLHKDHVYASSYNFFGGQRSANTIKVNASDGSLVWSTPSVRTDVPPVVVDDDTILVSGGVPYSPTSPFSGSVPSIELIDDLGASATLVWDSFSETHEDLNNDGDWDPGEPFVSLGGWGHVPVMLPTDPPRLLVATMEEPGFAQPLSHAAFLHVVDLTRSPSKPGFILDSAPSAGTGIAVSGSRVLSTSTTGLHARMLIRGTP